MAHQHPAQDECIIQLRGISKRFGEVWANADIDLDVRRGECHAVVGENGAGKSTLMQVLSGRWRPDRGEIRIAGVPRRFASPRDALRAGIGMVHQQLLVFPRLTALENILVGASPRRFPCPGRTTARSRILQWTEAFGFDLPLDVPVRELPFAQRQQIEILRALHRGAGILILDEPTSLLSPPEVKRLLGLLGSLGEQGRTLLFVSHRLSEVFALADTITVLKKGRRVASIGRAHTSPEAVARLMVGAAPGAGPEDAVEKGAEGEEPGTGGLARISSGGAQGETALDAGRAARETGGLAAQAGHETATHPSAASVLDLRAACAPPGWNESGLRDVSLRLRSGEILGIGGVVGNGQRSLARVVAGIAPLSSGRILSRGEDWGDLTIAERLRKGFCWLPANLVEEGFCPGFSLWQNYLLGRQREERFQAGGWLRRGAARSWTREELRGGRVRFEDVDQPLETLSGGNMQRVGLLRVLSGSPRLVLLEQPGRGLDLSGQGWLKDRLRGLSAGGAAVLVISYDLDELMALCHRIGILYRGSLMGTVMADPSAEERLARWMTGVES
jgi:simple sugar transport system ATP-binding protein